MVLDIEIDIDIGASNYCRPPEGNNLLTYFYVLNKIRNITNVVLLIFVVDLYEIESMRKSIKTLRSEKPTKKAPICYPPQKLSTSLAIFSVDMCTQAVYHIYLLRVDVKPSYID